MMVLKSCGSGISESSGCLRVSASLLGVSALLGATGVVYLYISGSFPSGQSGGFFPAYQSFFHLHNAFYVIFYLLHNIFFLFLVFDS